MKKIITVWLAITVAIMFTSCKTLPQENSSTTPSDTSTITSIYSELTNNEETTSTVVSQESSSLCSQDESSSASVTNSSAGASTNSSEEHSGSENKVLHPISGLPFKGRADPKTGLSWDGVSPIIYTYTDGTTGTEKREGATYECLPGMINTVDEVLENMPEDDGVHCVYCGKVGGNGTNGTCCRWLLGDVDCPICGEHVKVRTCHTCTRGCRYCGKPTGDGTNGTCYRDVWDNTKCPSCNADVPNDTCHTCG